MRTALPRPGRCRIFLPSPPASARMPRLALLTCALAAALLAGCAGSDEAARRQARPAGADGRAFTGFTLARAAEDVRTVQLYRTGDETSLPVIGLEAGQTLTLEFDVLESFGEPLSVYFYHADRTWRRDLLPVEFLATFQNDDLLDYTPSIGTEVPYAHYAYEFPNRNIRFLRSGNYVVRVTEAGNERAVLFERPFFITEQSAEVEFAVQDALGTGAGGSFFQPVARIRPPSGLDSPIYDYTVCFSRNARFELTRCAEEPTLFGASLFQFYLPEEAAFRPEGPLYELDLTLLQAGPQVVRVDYETSPYTVLLGPNYARFGSDLFEAPLSGQPVIETVRDAGMEPDIRAQYVEAHFAFVPQDEQPVAGPVILTGSFNGWVIDPAYELSWNAETGRYEGRFLIKQGLYVYSYYVDDPAERERLRRTIQLGQPNLYTAFVYLYDPSYDTDRLLAVSNIVGQ